MSTPFVSIPAWTMKKPLPQLCSLNVRSSSDPAVTSGARAWGSHGQVLLPKLGARHWQEAQDALAREFCCVLRPLGCGSPRSEKHHHSCHLPHYVLTPRAIILLSAREMGDHCFREKMLQEGHTGRHHRPPLGADRQARRAQDGSVTFLGQAGWCFQKELSLCRHVVL